MKTRTLQRHRRFQLEIMCYGNSYYIERVAELETALAKKPKSLQLDLVGVGEISADAALRIRAALLARSPKTQIIAHARSSLQNGSVLVWLLGDQRLIRDDATLYFRRATLPDEEETETEGVWKDDAPKYGDSFSEIDPEEGDYARVLQLINEYLPVNELVGRLVGLPVLRQFGLVENEQRDRFLATALGSKREAADEPPNRARRKRVQGETKGLPKRQARR
jgi:hypothetical protein